MQLTFNFLGRAFAQLRARPAPRRRIDHRIAWKHSVSIDIVFRPKARRYLLTLQHDGVARLVIPVRGTEAEGLRFLDRSEAWLLRRVAHWRTRSAARQPWQDGTRFLFRGDEVPLNADEAGPDITLTFADQALRLREPLPDYRGVIEAHLRKLAAHELKARTWELAREHSITIHGVSVRAQRSRWGSCSRQGTISLNWRLIQAPPFVVDYLIIHELMHRREMNHSKRYWKHVATAFPDYSKAESWLKAGHVQLR